MTGDVDMTVESDVRKLQAAVEKMSKAVEDLADEVVKLARGAGEPDVSSRADSAGRSARSARFDL